MTDHLHDDSSMVSVVLIVRRPGQPPWLFHSLSPVDADTLVAALRASPERGEMPDDKLRMWFNMAFFTAWRRVSAGTPEVACSQCRESRPDWFRKFSDLMRACHDSMSPDVLILNPANPADVPADVMREREEQWTSFLEKSGQLPPAN